MKGAPRERRPREAMEHCVANLQFGLAEWSGGGVRRAATTSSFHCVRFVNADAVGARQILEIAAAPRQNATEERVDGGHESGICDDLR